jgi:hypothetical protein
VRRLRFPGALLPVAGSASRRRAAGAGALLRENRDHTSPRRRTELRGHAQTRPRRARPWRRSEHRSRGSGEDALLAMSDADFKTAEDGLRRVLSRRLRVRVDGKPMEFEISFPQFRPRPERLGTEVFGLEATSRGAAPPDGKEILFFASRAFPAIELTFEDEGTGRKEFHICLPGEECPPSSSPRARRTPASGTSWSSASSTSCPSASITSSSSSPSSWAAVTPKHC